VHPRPCGHGNKHRAAPPENRGAGARLPADGGRAFGVGSCLVPFTSTRAQFIGINCCIKSIVEGPFTLIYIYAGELYPSTHRGTAVAFCNSFGRIAAMFAPVLLMRVFKAGGGDEHPAGSMMWVYLTLGAFAFVGLIASALFTRETLGKALAVRTKDIDLEEETFDQVAGSASGYVCPGSTACPGEGCAGRERKFAVIDAWYGSGSIHELGA